MKARSSRLLVLSLGILTMVLFVLDLAYGSVSFAFGDIWNAFLDGPEGSSSAGRILWQLRLPRTLTAGIAGAALASSGLLMQTYFRNPLAGPFVLGVSSGASLGVALALLAGWGAFGASVGLTGSLGLAAVSFAGAFAVMVAILLASRVLEPVSLLIVGLLLGYATNALVTVLLHFSSPERIQRYVAWTFGSFAGVTWSQLTIMAPLTLVGLLIPWCFAKDLDGLLLGEESARSLGVDTARVGRMAIVVTALLAGVITAYCGPIGFVGVAIPHLARGILARQSHRVLLPVTALAGTTTALFADLVARLPGWAEVLPLNAVTALIGAPVVGWVILRRGRRIGFRGGPS